MMYNEISLPKIMKLVNAKILSIVSSWYTYRQQCTEILFKSSLLHKLHNNSNNENMYLQNECFKIHLFCKS